jgi:hypothetical protein
VAVLTTLAFLQAIQRSKAMDGFARVKLVNRRRKRRQWLADNLGFSASHSAIKGHGGLCSRKASHPPQEAAALACRQPWLFCKPFSDQRPRRALIA